MVRGIQVSADGTVTIDFALTVASCPLRSQINSDIVMRISSMVGVTSVDVVMAEMNTDEKAALMQRRSMESSRDCADKLRFRPTRALLQLLQARAGSVKVLSPQTWLLHWRRAV